MKVRQICLTAIPTPAQLAELSDIEPQLLLAFGSCHCLDQAELLPLLTRCFPEAHLAGCTTAGEIAGAGVSDGQLVLTALHFDAPGVVTALTDLQGMDDSHHAGERLALQLQQPGLHSVLLFGQGVRINGSALIEGLRAGLAPGVRVSGGLAGDDGEFKGTLTLSRSAISPTQIVAVGFHAPRTQLRHGCFHGWRPFGPARKVTRAAGNVLLELDGQPALEVYRRYLGDYAKDLPASGLLFPFEALSQDRHAVGLIRTILGIDEEQGSLVLAGDVVENGYLRLMHASVDSLVEGAQTAAEATAIDGGGRPGLALLVSCVGRKLVMGARVDEEVEAVAAVFGAQATVAGFYSNGEVSPVLDGVECRLHNQTMAITYLAEADA